MYDKTKFIYVGIDLHKEQHTAVIMDCFNEKLGEITFQNKPSEFGKLVTKSKNYCTDGKQIVFALENSYGYSRALAAWLIERDYLVKNVNPALSYAYRKSVPQYKKNDSYDAQCVARVAINELNNLPDAMPEDMYWTLSQLVNRRTNLKVYHVQLKNQLHEQVCITYPSYKQFFQDIGRPMALYLFFVKSFSSKKLSEFPTFTWGISILNLGNFDADSGDFYRIINKNEKPERHISTKRSGLIPSALAVLPEIPSLIPEAGCGQSPQKDFLLLMSDWCAKDQ